MIEHENQARANTTASHQQESDQPRVSNKRPATKNLSKKLLRNQPVRRTGLLAPNWKLPNWVPVTGFQFGELEIAELETSNWNPVRQFPVGSRRTGFQFGELEPVVGELVSSSPTTGSSEKKFVDLLDLRGKK
nr:hypothetical protein Iba_chr08eCG1230 [Ipomoea batatas]